MLDDKKDIHSNRIAVCFSHKELELLQEAKKKTGASMGEIVRRSVTSYLQEKKEPPLARRKDKSEPKLMLD